MDYQMAKWSNYPHRNISHTARYRWLWERHNDNLDEDVCTICTGDCTSKYIDGFFSIQWSVASWLDNGCRFLLQRKEWVVSLTCWRPGWSANQLNHNSPKTSTTSRSWSLYFMSYIEHHIWWYCTSSCPKDLGATTSTMMAVLVWMCPVCLFAILTLWLFLVWFHLERMSSAHIFSLFLMGNDLDVSMGWLVVAEDWNRLFRSLPKGTVSLL